MAGPVASTAKTFLQSLRESLAAEPIRPQKAKAETHSVGGMEFPTDRSKVTHLNLQGGTFRSTPGTSWRATRQESRKKVKKSALQKAHWSHLPESLRSQCEAMGLQANAPPPPPPDLQTLLKEHLSSLPADLKDAVEKICLLYTSPSPRDA